MNQPFAFDEEGRAFINESEILKSQMAVSAVGVSLPPDFAEKAQEKADLLERRLSRLEQALGLPSLSIAGVDSSEALAAAIRNADLIPELLKPLSGQ
ncbi:hypothetical protein GIW54_09920 [Pseudomonas proteolytica]|uniref:Uncharacterized protein n=1 Tax=Pseudomonas proteolytica TaxID=219574 RepID=A0AAW5A350_9PSED|nr:hypothetical protein [Pseudomonas proteolytica]MCF5058327.1 hypothetical protein [Pseudomonas proteolytica]MCF5101084.1 hypothetical protein [Pseudomonas proteolytica]